MKENKPAWWPDGWSEKEVGEHLAEISEALRQKEKGGK